MHDIVFDFCLTLLLFTAPLPGMALKSVVRLAHARLLTVSRFQPVLGHGGGQLSTQQQGL